MGSEKDCLQIDLNCGCPKKFSIAGGMGAALLETPDVLVKVAFSHHYVKGLTRVDPRKPGKECLCADILQDQNIQR